MSPEEIQKKTPTLKKARAVVHDLAQEIGKLKEENLALKEKLAKLQTDSSNSSKPPSTDFFKDAESKAKEKNKNKRKRKKKGDKKKEKKKEPRLTKDEHITKSTTLDISHCPHTGAVLSTAVEVKQRIYEHCELKAEPVDIFRYEMQGRYCEKCQRYHFPPTPHGGRSFGPRFESLLGYLKPQMSTRNLVHFVEEVCHFPTSKSTIQSAIDRVSKALKEPYEEARDSIKDWSVAFIDETGWKLQGRLSWAWMFCCTTLAVTVLKTNRSAEVLFEVLGEVFGGAIVSDFYSAYIKYNSPRQQFCLAHLVRTLLGLTKSPIKKVSCFADGVVERLRRILILFHRREDLTEEYYKRKLRQEKKALKELIEAFDPPNTDSRRIKKRMLKHWQKLFGFLEDPNIYHATNNHSERMIRFLVLIRKISLGSQSEKGLRWIERAATATQSLRLQDRNVFAFYVEALSAYYDGIKTPSILPELEEDTVEAQAA
jgi:hypothetical protein